MVQAVNSDADFLIRHAAQMASRFHHTTKILLTASGGTVKKSIDTKAYTGNEVVGSCETHRIGTIRPELARSLLLGGCLFLPHRRGERFGSFARLR